MTAAALRIRPFEPDDEAAVVDLWRAAGLLVNPLNDPARDIRFCHDSGHGEILVGAAEDGRIAAAVMVGHDGHRGWLYYLAVHPGARDRGFGRRMVRAAEHWLEDRGVPKVELMVRSGNSRVIGFYQRLGYVVEPREVMARRLDGKAVPMGGSRSDEPVVITYLEMTARPRLPRIDPAARKLALLRAEHPTVSFYRYLYDTVGQPWVWTERSMLSDEALAVIIQDQRVEIYVLYVDGVPAGYAELDRRPAPDIDLAYFGIMPDFIGRRLGPYLLANAIDQAWRYEPRRLTVNTCTLDHPKALPMYQRFGFRPYQRREVPAPWQRGES